MQDEIAGLAGNKLTLTPGLRYDRRTLKPEVDALSQTVLMAIGRQAVSQTDSAFSPKLGALWQFSPVLAGYGQIVRGFRAPNYEEMNGVGLTLTAMAMLLDCYRNYASVMDAMPYRAALALRDNCQGIA